MQTASFSPKYRFKQKSVSVHSENWLASKQRAYRGCLWFMANIGRIKPRRSRKAFGRSSSCFDEIEP